MPYLLFVKKQQNLKLSSAAHYGLILLCKEHRSRCTENELKFENIFISININICVGRSKESTHRDSSFDLPTTYAKLVEK